MSIVERLDVAARSRPCAKLIAYFVCITVAAIVALAFTPRGALNIAQTTLNTERMQINGLLNLGTRQVAVGERGNEHPPEERRRQRGDAMQLEPRRGVAGDRCSGQERPRRGRLDSERQHPKGEAPLEPAERAPDEHRHRQRDAGEAGGDWKQRSDGQAGQWDAVKAAGASFRPRNVDAEVPCPSLTMWRPLRVAECLET